MLAQTFGLPVIGPDRAEMRAITPPENHDLLYEGQRPKPLVQMMKRLIDMPDAELAQRRAACFAYAHATAPAVISRSLAATLSSLFQQEPHDAPR
jgi:hypothetical protein